MSLSRDGRFLAVGGPKDNNGVGTTWVFRYDGSSYREIGKIVGNGATSTSAHQGEEVLMVLVINNIILDTHTDLLC